MGVVITHYWTARISCKGIARQAKWAVVKVLGYTPGRKQELWRILVHVHVYTLRYGIAYRQISHQMEHQLLMLQARPTYSRCATVHMYMYIAFSDLQKLFCILLYLSHDENFRKPFPKATFLNIIA